MPKRVKYTVYQLPHSNIYIHRLFRGLDEGIDMIDLNCEGYRKIYSGYVKGKFKDSNEILEKIFLKLNWNHPKNFQGHSLSVSDIVQLSNKYFHCQSVGWRRIKTTNSDNLAKRSIGL